MPALAAEILHQNKLVEKSGHLPLKFESMLIGNGWTEPRTQYKGYEEYSCANDSACKLQKSSNLTYTDYAHLNCF